MEDEDIDRGLEKIGLSPEQTTALKMFSKVPGPEEEAFDNDTPIAVQMTVGQANWLRAALRAALATTLTDLAMRISLANLAGAELPDPSAAKWSPSRQVDAVLAVDNLLTGAVVEAEAEAIGFTVPDFIPEVEVSDESAGRRDQGR